MLMKSSAKHGAILFFRFNFSLFICTVKDIFFHFVMFRLFSFAGSVYNSLNIFMIVVVS